MLSPSSAIGSTRNKEQETNFTARCKSALAVLAVPDDPSRIEQGDRQIETSVVLTNLPDDEARV